MKKGKKKKLSKTGSILVYSLILMFAILTISIGLTRIVVTKQKTASDTNKSSQAFQVANSGVEKVLQELKGQSGNIGSIANLNCSGDRSTFSFGDGTVTVKYLNSSGDTLDCSDSISDIAKIKSVGEVNNTKRAVEVAMAAGGGSGITGGCIVTSNRVGQKWGEGCKNNGTIANGCAAATASGYECGISSVPLSSASSCLCIKN